MIFNEKASPKNSLSTMLLLNELSGQKDLLLLCQALFHADRDVAIGGALVLGHIKDLQALPYLLHALLTTDKKRAQALMWAIGELGDESATKILLEALNANFIPKNALLALGKIGSFETIDALVNRLEDEDESMRALAAKILLSRFILVKDLAPRIGVKINSRLALENSRRVKLLLSVIKRRLEQAGGLHGAV